MNSEQCLLNRNATFSKPILRKESLMQANKRLASLSKKDITKVEVQKGESIEEDNLIKTKYSRILFNMTESPKKEVKKSIIFYCTFNHTYTRIWNYTIKEVLKLLTEFQKDNFFILQIDNDNPLYQEISKENFNADFEKYIGQMNNLVLDYCFSPSEEYLYFNLSLITNIQAEELEKKLIQIILHKSGIYINNRNNSHEILSIFTLKFNFKELPKKDFFKAAQKIKRKDESIVNDYNIKNAFNKKLRLSSIKKKSGKSRRGRKKKNRRNSLSLSFQPNISQGNRSQRSFHSSKLSETIPLGLEKRSNSIKNKRSSEMIQAMPFGFIEEATNQGAEDDNEEKIEDQKNNFEIEITHSSLNRVFYFEDNSPEKTRNDDATVNKIHHQTLSSNSNTKVLDIHYMNDSLEKSSRYILSKECSIIEKNKNETNKIDSKQNSSSEIKPGSTTPIPTKLREGEHGEHFKKQSKDSTNHKTRGYLDRKKSFAEINKSFVSEHSTEKDNLETPMNSEANGKLASQVRRCTQKKLTVYTKQRLDKVEENSSATSDSKQKEGCRRPHEKKTSLYYFDINQDNNSSNSSKSMMIHDYLQVSN